MIEISMLLIGISAHWLKKLMEIHRDTGKVIGPVEAFKAQPYHVAWVSILALAGGLALYDMGQLTTVSALLFGFSADSAAAALKRKVQQ